MSVAIGIDGGGSRTAAVREDSGAFVYGAPSNPSALGLEGSARAMCAAVRTIEPSSPVKVFAGVAGAARPEVASAIAALMQHLLGAGSNVHVEGDMRIALRALVPHGPGIVVVAGTGSFAYAESGERTARAGGYGYVLGDEGSGYAIGLAGLRSYARILDGRLHDAEFGEAMAAASGAADREALLAFTNESADRVAAIAGVAPAVLALASAGHRGATKIVQQASADLAELAKSAAVRAGLLDAMPAVGLYGGLMSENSLLTYLLETRIAAEIPGASILRSSDAGGAARAAAKLAALLPE